MGILIAQIALRLINNIYKSIVLYLMQNWARCHAQMHLVGLIMPYASC